MKKLLTLIIVLVIFCQNDLFSQININPDPNGPPWIVGGMPEITPELQAR